MPKIVDHDAYREKLLGRAFELFAQQGYGEVSMRQVAERLDVSTGALYHYFPSKEALFEQAVALVLRRDLAQHRRRLAGLASLDDKLTALFDLIIEERQVLISALLLTIDFCRRRPAPDGQQDAVAAALAEYVAAISDLLALPERLVAVVLAAVDGLLLQHYPATEPEGLAVSLAELRRLVLRMNRE